MSEIKPHIGLTVKYNNEMTGIVIDENEDHLLIQFERSKYCILKSSIEPDSYSKRELEKANPILF